MTRRNGKHPPALSPEQLQEYRIRLTVLNQARGQADLCAEALARWLQDRAREHRLKGRVRVDGATGLLSPVLEASDG